MPVPAEYQRATDDFYAFLLEVREAALFGSTHQAFTMTEGVLRVFRMRLETDDAIRFAVVLPAGLRALFVTHWDPSASRVPWGDRAAQMRDVRSLRADHNYSVDDAIEIVWVALQHAADPAKLDAALDSMPPQARAFWMP
jgi:uncharacterized protein (DUF2267 family)